MTAFDQAASLLPALTRGEKAALLLRVAQELGGAYPGIESTPGVCGGDPCIVRTRIPVWTLERSRQLGLSESEILANYPTLRAEDLVHAWACVQAHAADIERQIRESEEG
jgi:uncharacterized protein (DUF433 family)